MEKPKSMTQRMNDLIGGIRHEKNEIVSGVKNFATRVKKNINEDQDALTKGKIGRYQYTNPFRK